MRRLGAALGLAFALTIALPGTVAADSIARTWELGFEPFGMVIDPGDGRVYVANSKYVPGPGTISVVDPSRSVGGVTSLMTSGAPGLLALDAVNRRLYSSNQDRTLQVFDLTTMRLEATLPVGGLGVAVDSATRRVYVVDFVSGASRLVVIDGATNTIIQTQAAPPKETFWGIALDAAINRVYVTNMNIGSTNGPSLVVLDSRDLTVVDDVPLPFIPRFAISVDEARHRVYVAGADPNPIVSTPAPNPWPNSMLYALDGSTREVLATVGVPGYPSGIAVTPGGERIFVTDPCSGCQWGYREIDASTFDVVRFNATPWPPMFAAMHPDGRLYLDSWGATNTLLGHLAAVSLGNTPPSISTVSFSPSVPTTNDRLQAWDDAFDVDLTSSRMSTDLERNYEWSRNGVVLPGQTAPELDLSSTGLGDRGDTISVRVRVTDRDGASASATRSVVIANAAPSVSAGLDSAAPKTNDLLHVTAGGTDADGDPVTLTYQWSRNGTTISGATTATLDLAASGDRGDNIAVRVTGTDGHGGIGTADASVTVTNTAPSAPTLVLSSNAPTTNEVLRATASSIDADGDALVYGFAYYVNERFVWHSGYTSGSVSFDLSLPNWGDRGDAIRVVVVATDGSAESSWTEVSAVVAMTVDVALSDATPTTRDTLIATALVADPGGPALTYTYVWRVNGVVKRTTSATTATTDSLDLAARGVSRQGDVVVCEVLASDGVSTGTGIAQALVTNKH